MPGSETDKEHCGQSSVRHYWLTYGLVGYCGQFRFVSNAQLQRGQLVLIRSHRGIEIGRVLWPVMARLDGLRESSSRVAVPRSVSKPIGDVLRPLDDTDPFLREHCRQVSEISSWLEEKLQTDGERGVICEVECVYEPLRLGVLYLGLHPEAVARLSTLLEQQFHTSVEWYDASEWLDADRAWQDRLQAGERLYPPRNGEPFQSGGCETCGCARNQAHQMQQTSHRSCACTATAATTQQQSALASAGCSTCVLFDWIRKIRQVGKVCSTHR
jgi:hypothetical protein